MKKVLILLLLSVFVGGIFADEIMQPAGPDKSLTSPRETTGYLYSSTRDRPAYEFIVDPTTIISSYYDYMPGNYCGLPLRIQPEISNPFGLPAGGAYVVFHTTETASATRRVYYAYIDANGNVTATDPVGVGGEQEGYPGIDIDPVTANPIAAWHAPTSANPIWDVLTTYDLFHMMGSPGLWIDKFVSIDNPEVGEPLTGFDDDEFIWPYVYIDSSPLGGDYRRVYISGGNFTSAHGDLGLPSENSLIAYADFDTEDMNNQYTLDWNYRTMAQMDAWNAEDPIWMRPYKGCVVQDNLVAYAGYVFDNDATISDAFVLINENYGEGPFEYYAQTSFRPMESLK